MNASKAVLTTLVVALACGGATSKVSLDVRGDPSAKAASAGEQGFSLGNGISLGRVRMVIRRLELENESEETHGRGEKHAEEFTAGPLLLDLGASVLSGRSQEIAVADVPKGVYDEVSFEIGRLGPAAASANSSLEEVRALGASLVVEGAVDGHPFRMVSRLEAREELETQIAVGVGTAKVTLSIDPAAWFKAADGSRLDPRKGEDQKSIEANIRRSMRMLGGDDEGARHR